MLFQSSRGIVCLLLAFLLTSCAAPPKRSAAGDQAIRSIAVVSLLDEKTPVQRIGLTVFNNKTVVLDQTGVLNDLAIGAVESALRTSRPDWEIKDARAAVPALTARWLAAGLSWQSHVSAISSDLEALAAQLQVDAVLIVTDYQGDKPRGPRVGAWIRTLSLDSIKTVHVRADILLVLVNKRGEQLSYRGPDAAAAYLAVPASELGMDYDMSMLSSQPGQEKLRGLMRERLRSAVLSAAANLGY